MGFSLIFTEWRSQDVLRDGALLGLVVRIVESEGNIE